MSDKWIKKGTVEPEHPIAEYEIVPVEECEYIVQVDGAEYPVKWVKTEPPSE